MSGDETAGRVSPIMFPLATNISRAIRAPGWLWGFQGSLGLERTKSMFVRRRDKEFPIGVVSGLFQYGVRHTR